MVVGENGLLFVGWWGCINAGGRACRDSLCSSLCTVFFLVRLSAYVSKLVLFSLFT